MAHEVTLITGDGTGPELAEAARQCVDATGVKINWDVQEAGVDVMARTGTPLPDAVLESIKRTKCAGWLSTKFTEKACYYHPKGQCAPAWWPCPTRIKPRK